MYVQSLAWYESNRQRGRKLNNLTLYRSICSRDREEEGGERREEGERNGREERGTRRGRSEEQEEGERNERREERGMGGVKVFGTFALHCSVCSK